MNRIELADIIAALPEDGSQITEDELVAALSGNSAASVRTVAHYLLWKAAGFCIRRNSRGHVIGYHRWVDRGGYGENDTHETVTKPPL